MLISIAGSQMQLAAILWHISEISNQPIALGAVGLVSILPVLVLSLLAAALGWATLRRLDSL